jgi:hypothetical protein
MHLFEKVLFKWEISAPMFLVETIGMKEILNLGFEGMFDSVLCNLIWLI